MSFQVSTKIHTMKLLSLLICLWFLSYKDCFAAKSKDHCIPCLSRKCNANEEMICNCSGKIVKMDNKGQISYPKATVSLGFTVDVSGSMSTAIENIQNNIKAIVVQNADDTIFNKFVLVSFRDKLNDPRSHGRSSLVSANVPEIKKWVDKLQASGGGGDCNEDALWGIQKTAELVSRGSVILLYTDAGAKDYQLKAHVTNLLIQKDIRLVLINSNDLCYRRGRGRLAVLKGADALWRVVHAHDGKVYNTTGNDDKYVLEYIQARMPHGLAFIRTMPKTMEELKTAAAKNCDCNARLLSMKCYPIFKPKNKRVDGMHLKLKENTAFLTDSFVHNDLAARVVDLDTDTFIYATAKSSNIWLLVDLVTAEVLHTVYLVRRALKWSSGDKEIKDFRKYSIGLTSDSSVWKRSFDWSKFSKCGSTYEGPPTGNKVNFEFVCGLTDKFQYVSVYKEVVPGMPNKMILAEVVAYKKDRAGSKNLMYLQKKPVKLSTYSSGLTNPNEYWSILDNNKNTFIQFSVEPTDHWLVVDTGTQQVITKIVVYRLRDNEEARKNFNSISAGISQLKKLAKFASADYHRCGDMYKGPPAKTQHFISFYCNLEDKSRFVALLKLATNKLGNRFEISELEVYEYDYKA